MSLSGHPALKTPMFMPVGTKATVKAVDPEELKNLGAGIILGNTYHLYLRPGPSVVERFGGVAQFMGWSGPVLTDSGGFQVFSLAGFRKISEQGVLFRSHLDGSSHELTPEKSMEIQRALGSDIVMAFDECPPYGATEEEVRAAVERTQRWAERGLKVPLPPNQNRFGIIQGGVFASLRESSAEGLTQLPFDGFAIGGLSVGEPPELLHEYTRVSARLLPAEKPRYLMGVGKPQDLVEGVRAGVDLFDCVMPTRNARNGGLFTRTGMINIKNKGYELDDRPIEEGCPCSTCRRFTRGYLRHLFVTGEVLALRLNTIHNLSYYLRLMAEMRGAIVENRFDEWSKDFYTRIHAQS